MKKWLSMILAFLLAFSLAGCTQEEMELAGAVLDIVLEETLEESETPAVTEKAPDVTAEAPKQEAEGITPEAPESPAEEALPEIEPLRAELKPSVQMCLAEGAVLGADTALFLKVHGQLPQLKSWKEGVDLPLLTTFEKRLILTKKDEISP